MKPWTIVAACVATAPLGGTAIAHGSGDGALLSAMHAAAALAPPQSRPGRIANNEGVLGGPPDFQPERDTPRSFTSYNHMIDNGRCSAKIGRKLTAALLSEMPKSTAELSQYGQLDVRLASCRATGPTRIHSLQRGSLAEGMVYKMAVAPTALAPDSPRYAAFITGERTFNSLREAADQPLIAATNCLAAQQPARALAVFASRHGSAAEASAMDALFAGAPGCAGGVRPANVSRSFLRAFLADSLQRLAVFSQGGDDAKG